MYKNPLHPSSLRAGTWAGLPGRGGNKKRREGDHLGLCSSPTRKSWAVVYLTGVHSVRRGRRRQPWRRSSSNSSRTEEAPRGGPRVYLQRHIARERSCLRRGGPGSAGDSKVRVYAVRPPQPHSHRDHHQRPGPPHLSNVLGGSEEEVASQGSSPKTSSGSPCPLLAQGMSYIRASASVPHTVAKSQEE